MSKSKEIPIERSEIRDYDSANRRIYLTDGRLIPTSRAKIVGVFTVEKTDPVPYASADEQVNVAPRHQPSEFMASLPA